jgi:hypothetical protein
MHAQEKQAPPRFPRERREGCVAREMLVTEQKRVSRDGDRQWRAGGGAVTALSTSEAITRGLGAQVKRRPALRVHTSTCANGSGFARR